MKTFFTLLTLFTITTPALGASSRTISADNTEGFFSGQNLVVDSGFEGNNKGAAWVVSGGSLSTTTSSVGRGSVSGTWDASATSQTLKSKLVSIPAGMYGKNGVVSVTLKCASDTCAHTLTAYDNSANLVTAQTITSSTTGYARTSVNFVFPSSGSIQLLLTSASNEPSISIDDAYLGLAEGFNILQVSQAKTLGKHVYDTSSQVWSQSIGGTFTSFTANASIGSPTVYGSGITAPGTKIPGIVLSTVGPGTYVLIFKGITYVAGTAGLYCRWFDGTTSGDNNGSYGGNPASGNSSVSIITGSFYYTTAQASTTFQLQCRTLTGASQTISVGNATSGDTSSFEMLYFPPTSEIAYRPEQSNWVVDANISGANPNLGNNLTVSSYTEILDAGLTLTNNSIPGAVTAQIPCSTTNASTGTTCSVGTESLGVAYNQPIAGPVEACVAFAVNSNSGERPTFQIVETPNNAQTILQQGKDRIPGGIDAGGGTLNQIQNYRVCGTFNMTSAGLKTLRLMYTQVSATGSGSSNVIYMDGSGGSEGGRDMHWVVKPISSSIQAPVLVGSVTSGSTGAERIERAFVGPTCSASPCTITSQSGSWLTSVTRNSTGNYSMNFAPGIFSAPPVCSCMGDNLHCIPSATTVSSMDFIFFNSGHVVSDTGTMHLICMGPR